MPLTLLRHTAPAVGPEVCYGASDVALAPGFDAEAAAVLARLPRTARIVTSPLARCARLADFLGARLGVPVTVDPDWRELDFGAWEGHPWPEIPTPEVEAWAADFMEARPHGGESVAMLLRRVRRAVARCCPEETWLAVTHGGPIRAALFAAGGGSGSWIRAVSFGGTVALPRALGVAPAHGTAADRLWGVYP
ncbi:MAG TPA: histidine phosphatase family protein [Amaricoccus sp.]|jgi:alpha-ribazole phosphatase|nr:histidine phosphatase family protein [Amaricoccus sp.]